MKRAWAVSVVAVLLMSGWGWAEPIDSYFGLIIDGSNTVSYMDGSGYNDGEFYYYPQTGWWNQWFFNSEEIENHWKKITYDIYVDNDTVSADILQVVINWSTPLWTDPTAPPLPEAMAGLQEDQYIDRSTVIWDDIVDGYTTIDGEIQILDYNPIWVSIDVRVITEDGNSNFFVDGDIYHECLGVPEPATLTLFSAGVLGLFGIVRRRRRK